VKKPSLPPNSTDITGLLKAWGRGDRAALDRLTPLVYDQLRRLAGGYVRKERAGHSFQATALVHEAYLRLVKVGEVDWQDRAHFLAVSARMMRRILVDSARARASAKRGGGAQREDHATAINFDDLPAIETERATELCALDDALNSLGRLDARRAQVIELRFFGGLSVEETAEILKVSPQTVMRDWKLARAWLTRELRGS
jgi:RNA polymerase sigma factor (TIGR02999 family)